MGTPTDESKLGKSEHPEPWLDLGLTKRQTDVLALVCEGKANLAIAKQLGITEGVVKLHVTAIYKGLRVRNRAEAILLASRLQSINMHQVRQAENSKLDLDWLTGDMTHQRLSKGMVLFRLGDSSDGLFYLQRGRVRLDEIGTEMGEGTLFGEIGIFSPEHRRTSTATCATDVDLFRLTADQVKRLFLLHPQFALFLVHLLATRLIADRDRNV